MALLRAQNSFSLRSIDLKASHSLCQLEFDSLQAGFTKQALNLPSLLGMTGAGLAFRAGRTLSLGIASHLFGTPRSFLTSQILNLTSTLVGFGTEVFAFEGITRSSRIIFEGANHSLLEWNGEQGFRQGLVHGALSLGSLKLSGHFFQTRNVLLQHFTQDSAMVGSHQFAIWLDWEQGPTQSLAQQYLHAEATLLQMNVGIALVHGFLPGLRSIERSLDHSQQRIQTTLHVQRIFRESAADPTMSARIADRVANTALHDQRVFRESATAPTISARIAAQVANKDWGGVTDPRQHNPIKFRYLVHAFNPWVKSSQRMSALLQAISAKTRPDPSEGDQSIDLFAHPDRLAERVSLSMSLIDETHIETWGPGGIIVGAPAESIVITSPCDAGIINGSRKYLLEQAKGHSLMSAEALLSKTFDLYNEVVGLARSDHGQSLQIRGFFIKIDARGKALHEGIASQMQNHARNYHLPLIEIQSANRPNALTRSDGKLWAHYEGLHYVLVHDNAEALFEAIDETGTTSFPSPDTLARLLNHFITAKELTRDEAAKILKGYHRKNQNRCLPRITRHATGEIERVDFLEGYGEDALRYSLHSNGHAAETHLLRHTQHILRTMQQEFMSFDESSHEQGIQKISLLSILERLRLLRSRMDPILYEELLAWIRSRPER